MRREDAGCTSIALVTRYLSVNFSIVSKAFREEKTPSFEQ